MKIDACNRWNEKLSLVLQNDTYYIHKYLFITCIYILNNGLLNYSIDQSQQFYQIADKMN